MTETLSTFEQAVEALYRLHVGVVGTGAGRHERPHKPVLLLAVLDLISEGHATPGRIEWSSRLRERFALYFQTVKRQDDQCTPENPFYYLGNEGWWMPLRAGAHGDEPLQGPPLVRDAAGGKVFASLGPPLAPWVINGPDRLRLREALIARYFPHAKKAMEALFLEGSVMEETPYAGASDGDDLEPKAGRSSGFRRVILEIYDYQCAACGLRIRLPMVEDLTFVDAAHLIPFSEQQNDHPTNGMALCKNHHWAMDRRLIAPHPNGRWVVSAKLKPHRSPGEKELVEMAGREFLPPREAAFFPAEKALIWRVERLLA